jgi:Histidinol dehydrogenase
VRSDRGEARASSSVVLRAPQQDADCLLVPPAQSTSIPTPTPTGALRHALTPHHLARCRPQLAAPPHAPALQDLPWPSLPADVTASFDVAYNNIRAFHEAQRSSDISVTTMPGVTCRRVTRPINAVGLYVPGGTAVLPSSALMLAVPAQIAGCGTVVLATPPRPDGSITPEVLYCAKKAGVTHLLKAGGAQAVAAMAWGTGSVPKVDKLFGPGNQYVTAAKMLLTNSEAMVAIDMPAGPSEVLVIAGVWRGTIFKQLLNKIAACQ